MNVHLLVHKLANIVLFGKIFCGRMFYLQAVKPKALSTILQHDYGEVDTYLDNLSAEPGYLHTLNNAQIVLYVQQI